MRINWFFFQPKIRLVIIVLIWTPSNSNFTLILHIRYFPAWNINKNSRMFVKNKCSIDRLAKIRNKFYLFDKPKSSKPKISSTPMELPWCVFNVSFFDKRAWFTWRTIQSNNAPYKHLAMASRAAIAWKFK